MKGRDKAAKAYHRMEGGLTQIEIAKKMGMTTATLSNKINNKADFFNKEIMEISKMLELDNLDIMAIFMN